MKTLQMTPFDMLIARILLQHMSMRLILACMPATFLAKSVAFLTAAPVLQLRWQSSQTGHEVCKLVLPQPWAAARSRGSRYDDGRCNFSFSFLVFSLVMPARPASCTCAGTASCSVTAQVRQACRLCLCINLAAPEFLEH